MEHDKTYLRVLNDLPFMFEVLRNTEQQADSFAVEMLRLRIIRERETVRLEEERERLVTAEKMRLIDEQKLTDGDD